jgi:hypothetical protein
MFLCRVVVVHSGLLACLGNQPNDVTVLGANREAGGTADPQARCETSHGYTWIHVNGMLERK